MKGMKDNVKDMKERPGGRRKAAGEERMNVKIVIGSGVVFRIRQFRRNYSRPHYNFLVHPFFTRPA
jgi:hypothetical protein